jgi:predicted lactoylglutathione lyase
VSFSVALPIADRRTAHAFYRDGLGLECVGEPAEDGVPEPLQVVVAPDVVVMLVPRGGFGWVTADHDVAEPGRSECLLSLRLPTPGDVDALVERARAAGAVVKQGPEGTAWGTYAGTFADPDGHLWMVDATP